MDMEKDYLISNIEEYGKLISFCIDKDISVFRTFWDEREKGVRCYRIDFKTKQCCFACRDHYVSAGYEIGTPVFYVDQYGNCRIEHKK